MRTTKWSIMATCFTVLGLTMSAVGGCAPAAAPTPMSKAAAPPPGTATAAPPPAPKPAAPAASATAKPAGPALTAKPAAPTATPKPAAEQPRYGGILTIGVGGDPPSLDVHREEAGFAFPIMAAAYNSLVKYDPHAWPESKVIPDLATNWELSADGKTYIFRLARGAKFHDGSPVTAEDVKFSFDRIRHPQSGLVKSPRRQLLDNVTNIDTVDDYTVNIKLGYPQASFIASTAIFFFAVMPKHVVLEKNNDMTKTMVGSGPFKFKNYTGGVGWEMERNRDYFVKGRPYLDGLKAYIIPDPFTRFAALRTKSILWWAPFPYMSVAQTRILEETLSDKIAVDWAFHPAWYGATFNVSRPPWSDARVRQAVSLTFDRKRMLAAGLEGAGVIGMSAQPPGEWQLPEEEMMKVPGYANPDLEGAKRLLAEAGFPNGFTADLLVRPTKPHRDTALVVKDAVRAIGIDLSLKIVETAVYMDARFRKAFDITAGGFGFGLTDPDTTLGQNYVTNAAANFGGYTNPHYDQLYLKQSQALDSAERRKIVWEMQRILLKDVPIAIAFWSNVPYARWREVRGFTPPVSYYNADQYQEMWLAK
ncbi:MAG: ABC transporter substrate-binding protein [Chloroflexi bacterium]|nr:ABC transporter substrate-binding protein [Chloroflexota bacterium]